MSKPAVFVDRDNTLIDDPGYLADPEAVKLLPGTELAIRSLRQSGFAIVVVTNQSGIARGLLDEETLKKIHARLGEQLAEKDAPLDAIYYCPYHPDGSVPRYSQESDLRKPAPGMLLKAAQELDIDLASSWMVGDSPRDVGAGQRAGCRTVRVKSQGSHLASHGAEDENEEFQADFHARNLVEAARIIKRESATTPTKAKTKTAPATAAKTAPPPPPAAPSTTPAGDEDEDAVVRKEILRHVRQITRQSEHDEFNLINLLGGLSQVVVGLLLILVFYQALDVDKIHTATLWAIVAAVFQIMSLTFFTMAKKK
ncbi:MAG: hypothetical protein DRP83_04950 [Planctomycetota bacterium]|nr:MAG: hypothetical protein DRP83_04950 [Planctomycetota bacterium]